jgi:hypothetical protein
MHAIAPRIQGGGAAALEPEKGDNSGLALQPEPEAEKEKATETPLGPGLRTRPSPLILPSLQPKKELVHEGYLEMVERLEPAIVAQLEKVKQVALAEGLDPQDLRLLYTIDITGNQRSVCVNCGRPTCRNFGKLYRTPNAEVDLLSDSLVVFMEVASRLGAKFGLIAYDEQVCPLRDVGPATNAADRAQVISRFLAFRNRREHPDPANRAWLQAMLKKWQPSDREKPAAGQPADRHALRVGAQMLNEAEGDAVKGLILAKGQIPRTPLRGFEGELKASGIELSGLAVGKNAAEIRRSMFTKTGTAHDTHEIRDHIGDRIEALLEKPKKGS